MLHLFKETLLHQAVPACIALCAFSAPASAQTSAAAVDTIAHALQEADTTLTTAAAVVVQAAPQVARVWPGFWSVEKPFAFTSRDPQTILLIAPVAPPQEYTPIPRASLPHVLAGRAYLRRGFPSGFGGFHQFYRIGDFVVPAMWLEHRELQRSLAHFYHEAFHGFQREAFAANPDHRPAFGAGEKRLKVDSLRLAQFEALAEAERQKLSRAVEENSPDQLKSLLQEYLALREQRTLMLPSIRAFERWEERYEGTATLVGYHSAVTATGAGTDRLRELLEERLSRAEPAIRGGAANKWRGYSVGAALGFVLDQLGEDWKTAVEQGASLDVLMARAVGFDPTQVQGATPQALES